MKSAYNVSDRIAMLYEGVVVEEGTPDQIRNSSNPIVRGFVEGRPEMIEEATRAATENGEHRGTGDERNVDHGHRGPPGLHRRDR